MAICESATRFDNDSYYKMSVNEETESATIIGEMNGEPVEFTLSGGGGGSSDFSTANVTINILHGTPIFSGVFVLPTGDPNQPYYMAHGEQNFQNGDIIQCVMYEGEGNIDISLVGASSATGTGDVEFETEEGSAFAYITGDCTITIS